MSVTDTADTKLETLRKHISAIFSEREEHERPPFPWSRPQSARDYLQHLFPDFSVPGRDIRPVAYAPKDDTTSARDEFLSYADLFSDITQILLLWPPNLFAFTAGVLSRTGAYSRVNTLEDWCTAIGLERETWTAKVMTLARQWVRCLVDIGNTEHGFLFLLCRDDRTDADQALLRDTPVPEDVREELYQLLAHFEPDGNLFDVWNETHKRVFPTMCLLNAVADAVCLGWGIRRIADNEVGSGDITQPEAAYHFATLLLEHTQTLATIDPSRCRILPKRHTPQVGVALRSMSLHLAYHRSSVKVEWQKSTTSLLHGLDVTEDGSHKNNQLSSEEQGTALPLHQHLTPAPDKHGVDGVDDPEAAHVVATHPPKPSHKDKGLSTLSLLLIPWPLRLRACDFVKVKETTGEDRGFYYNPSEDLSEDLRVKLRAVIEEAHKEVPDIDIAILPESAILYDSLQDLEDSLGIGIKAYFTGVRKTSHDHNVFRAINQVTFGWAKDSHPNEDESGRHVRGRLWHRSHQEKHHRWRLTDWQLGSYQLGGILHPEYCWWEALKINQRKVTFVNFGHELTICPLICEDLARQDPISDLIRAVGPSLVVGLLMDGPQLASRWSARYAGVLADDPGSSVITLTSAGMVDRYSVLGKQSKRVIGLWSDKFGPSREITLDRDAQAVILSLAVKRESEKTLDDRQESVGTYTLKLGGIHQVKVSGFE